MKKIKRTARNITNSVIKPNAASALQGLVKACNPIAFSKTLIKLTQSLPADKSHRETAITLEKQQN